MGRLVNEIAGRAQDTRSIMKLAEAVDALYEQLDRLAGKIESLEKKVSRSRS